MILLDTHVWVWWVQGDKRLPDSAIRALDESTEDSIVVSAISCWEVAMLHARERLILPCSLDDWLAQAIRYPGVRIAELSPTILVDSCRLPGEFHKDPADRMILATARALDCPLVSADRRVLEYGHAATVHPDRVAETLGP